MKHPRRWAVGALLAGLLAVVLLLELHSRRLRHENQVLRQQIAQLTPFKEQMVQQEMAKFQGTWEGVSMEVDGSLKPEAEIKKLTTVLEGDHWRVWIGGELKVNRTFKLDPAQQPRAIDLIPAPDPQQGTLIQGIYAFEGDQLTVCLRAVDNGDRPTEFATEPDSGLVLAVSRRVKK